jgi:Zn-finger nucleic acid-binding protein
MKCPIDNTELKMSDRQGIEIDYCPQCRGVWLDRGELDKIIERTAAPGPAGRERDARSRYDDDDDDRRRGGFFGNLFDFD